MSEEVLIVRETLYGSESSNTCGYCCKHYKALTPKQMHTKKCLSPLCPYLIKHDHEIWVKREVRKQKRKDRKANLEEKYLVAVHKKGSDANAVHTETASGAGYGFSPEA